jgi:magnesium transporter
LIEGMEEEKREEIKDLMKFEEETAGGLMTTDYIACLQTDRVAQVMEAFKQSEDPLDNISYIYVTDKDETLLGVITLRDLILNPPDTQISGLMKKDIVKLQAEDSLDQVAETFKKYKFLAIPVVDGQNRLEGIITLRDGVEATYPEFGE